MGQGMVYVFTGNGKGKTSAALGVAVRAALIGKNVFWISFFKSKDWDLAEKGLPAKFANLKMEFVGKGFMIREAKRANKGIKIADIAGGGKVIDTAQIDEHKAGAEEGIRLAKAKLLTKPFLLVMDEVLNAVSEGLIEARAVEEVMALRGESHVVLTGRAHQFVDSVLKKADLVTECKKVKHPYDQGKLAIFGLDF